MTDRPEKREAELTAELAALRGEIARLNARRIVTIQDRPIRFLAMQFARGLAFGLGSLMGATLLVSVGIYFLSQIELIPIIGEWASRLADEMRFMQDQR